MSGAVLRVLAVGLLMGWSLPLLAASLEWTDPINGDFNDATKWNVISGAGAPPPTAGDSVFLNEAGAYTIKLTGDEATDFLRATIGTVSLVGDSVATRTLDLTTGAADLSVRGAGTLNLGGVGTPLVVNVGDRFEVGHGSGGGDGTVNLSGVGSELNLLGVTTHNVGISGNVGRVNVTDDASLSFVEDSTLVVGRSSLGASSGFLEVSDGGDVTAGDIAVATIDSNAFGSLMVDGAGSTVTQLGASTLSVGNATAASTLLQLSNDAVFTSGTGAITLGHSALVNVLGGTFNANGAITTSSASSILIADGTLNVNAGLDNSSGGQIRLGGEGLLSIEGGLFTANDETLDSPELRVGGEISAAAAALRVSGAATADISTLLTIGLIQEGIVTVTSGGVLNNDPGGLAFSANTRVGQSDTGTLRIEAGGTVNSNDDAVIGSASTGDGTVEVDGVGSVWNVVDRLTVGDAGTGALRIENGGVVNSGTAGPSVTTIGVQQFSEGSVVVDGAGSEWNHNGNISVGSASGVTATLRVTDGGLVAASSLSVLGGQVDDVVVDGVGSSLTVSSMIIGDATPGGMQVIGGGVVTSSGATLGTFPIGSGNADVTISGAGSTWNAGVLTVGDDRPAIIRVENGATLNSTSTLVGAGSDFQGDGQIDVLEGGAFVVSGNLEVGRDGTALLRLNGDPLAPTPNAVATVTGFITLGDQGSIEINAGRLEFGSMSIEGFGRITGSGGELSGDLEPISGFTDAAMLPASLSGQTLDVSGVRLVNNGVLFGDRGFEVSLTNTAAGEVEIGPGERLRFAAGTNAGEINNFGGQIRFDGAATNEASGFVGGRGQFIADGGWINDGVMAFSAGPADLLGDFVNAPGGTVVTSGNAVTTFFDDLTHNGAEIRTAEGSATVVFGAASGAGAYTGTGTVFFEGDLRPGNSPGTVTFDGDVVVGTAATTVIEFAGNGAGEFDRLDIAGAASLDGGLVVTLLDDYAPELGDVFEFVSAGDGVSGSFSIESLPDLGALVSLGVFYQPGSVSLAVVPGLAGDYNADGVVDAADYTVWRDNLNQVGVGLGADGNRDGSVDIADYELWRDNYGSSITAFGTASVPEPSTVSILLLAFVSTRSHRRLR